MGTSMPSLPLSTQRAKPSPNRPRGEKWPRSPRSRWCGSGPNPPTARCKGPPNPGPEPPGGRRGGSFGEWRPRTGAPPVELSVTIAVRGARRHEIFWDGASSADEVSTTAGEHHLVIVRGKRVAWSGWVSALAAGRIDVWIPDDLPCSVEDLAGATLVPHAAGSIPKGVRCGAWAIAAPGPKR